ncbi:GNAT family N-acetyltransferase [Arenibaculum pallidiluteum]|uniref:GNAT family N-acetyltransferase n=1 Tax=Arenibaculum pallidiluteum TaxID=2812559 RepID=UPI001A975933|nr:GNAT family N-acetyltransferase [Arenibaculum pallidiluteum]
MPDTSESLELSVLDGIGRVDPAEWDACAGTDNPFLSHAFLLALEDSRSTGPKTGWLPRHLALRDASGRLIGGVPAYVKSHSYGEYVFDHAWANAYERAGGRYYPKLQVAVPFTPVTGPRLLVRPDAPDGAARLLIGGLEQVAERLGVSSVHATFPIASEWEAFGEAGWLLRLGYQFHWRNEGYGSFEDFLAALSSRKRKAIRKERESVAASGLTLRTLTGGEITARHWDAFHRFYEGTVDRKWGWAYLTRDFFHMLGERLGDRVVLVVAEDDGRPVAGALNLRGADALYGRNWGAAGEYPNLHFEACYYRAIDFAIAHGLARVEAGAQGEHKIARGYLPVRTYSAHWIADPGLRDAVDDFLRRERPSVDLQIAAMMEESPFRKEG